MYTTLCTLAASAYGIQRITNYHLKKYVHCISFLTLYKIGNAFSEKIKKELQITFSTT